MQKRSRLRRKSRGSRLMRLILFLLGLALVAGLYLYLDVKTWQKFSQFVAGSDTPAGFLEARGTIFDRNYKELAVTLDRVSVYANVREVDGAQAAEKLGEILDVQPAYLKNLIDSEPYRAWLAKNITRDEEEQILELDLPGVFLHREKARFYPQHETAAHVVGFVGKSMGLAGVEYHYNSLLTDFGSHSGHWTRVDADRENAANTTSYLVLTLDLKIQTILEKFVQEIGKPEAGTRVAAMLMESSTGRVIAMASQPSYDPNSFEDYGRESFATVLDEPIAIPREVGSIFWQASLLQSRYEGGQEVWPWSIHSNSRSLGSQLKLWDRLGLNDRLSVDFIRPEREVDTGRMINVEPENLYDSFTDTATPLQLATALNGLLSGGELPTPHVMDRVAIDRGEVYSFNHSSKATAVSEPVAEELRRSLQYKLKRGPVSSGYLEAEAVSYKEKKHDRQYTYNKIFFSAIPRKEPKLMLFVFASLPPFSPSPAKTKSRFPLAESANKIILRVVAMQEVMPNLSDMMTIEEKNEMNFELHREVGQSVFDTSLKGEEILGVMPDLKGLSLRKSLRLLKDLKLEIQISGTGVVVEQDPLPGSRVKQGELCRLVLKPH